jgi:hypothetical protein
MANQFDSTNYRTLEPTIEEYGHPIVAGDLLVWKRSDLNTDYSNSAYTLSYQARQAGNLATDNADPRSSNQKIYEAIVATIEGRASQDQMSYSIAGRSLSRMSVQDLIEFEGIYKARWMKEVNQNRINDNLGTRNTILARLPT